MYKFHFPKLRSSMVKICYDSDPINPVRDTVYIHTRDTLCIRDTVTVIAPVKKRPFCMAVKTNLLYDAVLIPDIGVEFCLGKNWSVAGNWMYAWWKSDRKHNYWRIYGEMWSCAAGSVGERWKNRFPGIMSDCTGRSSPMISNWVGKVTWGINGVTGRRGLRLLVTCGTSVQCGFHVGNRLPWRIVQGVHPFDGHYVWQTTKNRRWFGPTKAGISLVWLIGRGNYNEKKGGRQ